MSSFDLVVTFPTLKQADAALERLGVTASKSAKVTTKAFRAMQTEFGRNLREIKSQMANSKALENQKRREAQAAVAAATKAANATRMQAREMDRLTAKYNPAKAAAKQYDLAIEEITRAQALGILSSTEYKQSINRLKTSFAGFNAQADKSSGWSNQFVQGSSAGGKSANRMGMAIQQAGYQVGDFAVQVQSGQRIMVAFSQQATQLVGVLPMVATNFGISMKAAIGLSAGLGIAIPVITGLAGLMFNLGKSAEEVSTQLDDTKSALQEYINLAESVDSFGGDGFSVTRENLEAISQAYTDLIAISKVEAFQGITALNESLTSTMSSLGKVDELLSGEPNYGSRWLMEIGPAEDFIDVLNTLDESTGLQDQYDAAISLRDAFQSTVDTSGELTESQQDFFKALSSALFQMELLGAATEDSTNGQVGYNIELDKMVALFREAQEAKAEDKQTADELLATMLQENEIQQAINLLGEESVYVALLRQEAEEKTFEAMLSTLDVSEDLKQELRDALAEAQALGRADVSSGITEAANEAGRLRDNLAAARAQSLETSLESLTGGNPDFFDPRGGPLSGRNTSPRVVPEENRPDYIPPSSSSSSGGGSGGSSGGGGGSSSRDDPQKTLLQLQAQAIAVAELAANLTTEGDILREIQSLEKDLGDTRDQYSNEAIRQSAEFIVAEEQKRDAIAATQKQQEDLAKSIANTMGNSLMSVVDGTKSVEEAFKEMAASIIKQLFEVLVVQRLVANLTATLGGGGGGTNLITGIVGAVTGSADGNVLGSGNVIPFATGGVVSSAIMFPMAGNKTGLMGEAGPEAIMPLSRGSDGKLGVKSSGSNDTGDVNIYQTFSFAANGDESVKKLISQAAPEIAKMTKASMINDRRRGGATKQAFG